MQLTSKLPQVGTTVFTIMSALAQKHNAVNLGQGFPDFNMDETLVSLVNKAMKNGFNQYTHTNGLPQLREQIALKVKNLYNQSIDPSTQITITPGGTYAIYTALTAILQPGDEVIVFEPAYDSYIPNIVLNGAVPITIPLSFPNYSIPWEKVKKALNKRTKLIIINTPHNPTGSVLSIEDIHELKQIVLNNNLFVLSDEVYEHLIFDGLKHHSVVADEALLNRSFACFSFGKTYHCTGWKLGYCIAGEQLMHEFRKVHQFNCFSCDTPKQVALAEYLGNNQSHLQLGNQMQEKRDYLRSLLQKSGFEPIPSNGSYFECYQYHNISNMDDKDFAVLLTEKFGVTGIPVSAFYKDGTDNHVIRFCFAKKLQTLELAAKRLENIHI